MGLTDLEAIPETGAVFTIGRSRFADNVASHFFIRKDPVLSITCGDEHSAVICQTGRLFVFGSNDWGQLGLGHKNHVSKPSCVKALKPEKVTHVACGRAHTLICTGSQKIFACGSDQEGQLGRGMSAIGDSTSTPVLVYDSGLTGSKIVEITAGSHHSLALTSDGGVLAWGSNLEGQLGLPDVSGLVNKPTKVHIPEPVKQISAGYYHSTFLTESGLVYVCGESESGKLGIDVSFSTQVTPKQMQLPSPAVHVACGGHHTVILAENGGLYCTGSNSTGQLGLGTNLTELHTPKLLPRGAVRNEKISRVSCGESHTAVVTESGKLYTCGDGRHGKLGLEENENNVHELTFVQRYNELFVTSVACGGCHTILVGQRRETNNRSQRDDNSQVEHIQKRNPLPPLKLSRRQSENTRDEQNNVGETTLRRKNSTESVTNAQETVEASLEKIEEDHKDDKVGSDVTDSTNDVEKSDSPEKSTSEKAEEKSPDTEEKTETTPADTKESEESERQDENSELRTEDESLPTKTDDENNVQEEEKLSESMNDEKDNKENGNETSTETRENSTENNEEINSKNGDDTLENKDEADSNRDAKSAKESTQESNNGDDAKREKTSPKEETSPSDSTPPKPPRLKTGSENSSTEGASSTEKGNEKEDDEGNENEENTEDIPAKKSDATEEEDELSGRKEESGSTKSGSTKSARSRVAAEETIEIDEQNDKDRVVEEEKVNNAHDDADVVQSPAPKTGRISKIFKSKKPQTMENGTKTSGTANQKSKSKTCTIL